MPVASLQKHSPEKHAILQRASFIYHHASSVLSPFTYFHVTRTHERRSRVVSGGKIRTRKVGLMCVASNPSQALLQQCITVIRAMKEETPHTLFSKLAKEFARSHRGVLNAPSPRHETPCALPPPISPRYLREHDRRHVLKCDGMNLGLDARDDRVLRLRRTRAPKKSDGCRRFDDSSSALKDRDATFPINELRDLLGTR